MFDSHSNSKQKWNHSGIDSNSRIRTLYLYSKHSSSIYENFHLYFSFNFSGLQVESAPNSGPMLAVARNLRMEKDKDEKLQSQKHEQRNYVSYCFNRFVGFLYM